jgi:hypothetical protein
VARWRRSSLELVCDLEQLARARDALGEQRAHEVGDLGEADDLALLDEEAVEHAAELARGLVAAGGVALERAHDDVVEEARQALANLRRRRDVELVDRAEDRGLVGLVEQLALRDQLPRDDAEAPHVGAAIRVLAGDDLGREIGALALEDAGARGVVALARVRDAEVHHLDVAVVGDEQVIGRDIAMDDVERCAARARGLVRGVQALACALDDAREDAGLNECARWGRRVVQLVLDRGQRLAAEQLHREVVGAVVLVEVEDRAHVGVMDLRGDARLVEEHLDEALVACELRADALERDVAMHAGAAARLREIDRRHAAAADLDAQPVRTECVAHSQHACARRADRARARALCVHGRSRFRHDAHFLAASVCSGRAERALQRLHTRTVGAATESSAEAQPSVYDHTSRPRCVS